MTSLRIGAAAASLIVLAVSGCAAEERESDDRSILFLTDDQERTIFECLEEKGWDLTWTGEGTFSVNMAADQQGPYERDNVACLEAAGVDQDGVLDPEKIDAAYDWYLEIEECLRAAGWATPQPPSRQGFHDTYSADIWMPWSQIPPEQLFEAQEDCPVMTPP